MKKYAKILFSILAAVVCATAFAADQPACKKSGKNCPMNNGKGMQLRQELRLLVNCRGGLLAREDFRSSEFRRDPISLHALGPGH
jgi:hypothetical protein